MIDLRRSGSLQWWRWLAGCASDRLFLVPIQNCSGGASLLLLINDASGDPQRSTTHYGVLVSLTQQGFVCLNTQGVDFWGWVVHESRAIKRILPPIRVGSASATHLRVPTVPKVGSSQT